MIKNKAELKRAINSGKRVVVTSTKNPFWPAMIGVDRNVSSHQSNAFTLATYRHGAWVNSWLYYSDYDVRDGVIVSKTNPDITMKVRVDDTYQLGLFDNGYGY